ncbi:putative serine/threonine-protein kinase [Sesbania bispinosa]|nr:putative serine/threonine-protein kinase [Sesbania bispinosa]
MKERYDSGREKRGGDHGKGEKERKLMAQPRGEAAGAMLAAQSMVAAATSLDDDMKRRRSNAKAARLQGVVEAARGGPNGGGEGRLRQDEETDSRWWRCGGFRDETTEPQWRMVVRGGATYLNGRP